MEGYENQNVFKIMMKDKLQQIEAILNELKDIHTP